MTIGKDAGVVAVKGVAEDVRAQLLKHLGLVGKVVVVLVGAPKAVVKVENLRREGG